MVTKFFASSAGLLLAALCARAGTYYGVVDLGTLGGASSSGAALSSNGLAAGWSDDAAGNLVAFSFAGSLLGLPGPQAGAGESQAHGINSAGTVAGTVYSGGSAQATVWENGQASPIAGAGSYAMAVNDRGQVAGSASGQALVSGTGGLHLLDAMAGWQWSTAAAINENGAASGTAQLASGAFRGVVWDESGSPSQLGTLGGMHSWAHGMNDAGLVAGSSTTQAGWMHAFLLAGGAMVDLGTLGGGNSGAYDVNSHGWVVGYSLLAGGASAAFLYADGVLYNLNNLIAGSGWNLQEATAINDSGQIVGTGTFEGRQRAFLLNPLLVHDGIPTIHNPEPGTLALMMTGCVLLGMGLYRRRRR